MGRTPWGRSAQQGRARDGGGGPCREAKERAAAKMEIHRHLYAFTWKKGVNDPSRVKEKTV